VKVEYSNGIIVWGDGAQLGVMRPEGDITTIDLAAYRRVVLDPDAWHVLDGLLQAAQQPPPPAG
jgi:hypothetical protein